MNNKLISFAAAAATLFAFAACNKDVNQIDVVTPGTGTYAKVSISMGTPGTRATVGNPDEFDAGTADEAKVNSIMLVVYDADGKVVGYGSTSNDKPAAGSGTENVSDTYEKVIELTMVGEKKNAATVVAYVNVANEILPLSQAKEETTDEIGKLGKFVMTNAAFFDKDDSDQPTVWKIATDIEDGSLYSSPEAAAAGDAKTTIYVERLAAKVNVSLKTGTVDTEAKINIVGADGETEYVLDFDAAKALWAPTGTAPEMYKLKNQWTEDLGDWTIGTNRNFWAKGVYYATPYADFTGKPVLNYVSSNALRNTGDDTKGIKMGASDYTTEHTYGDSVVNDEEGDYNALGAATSAFVLGQYVVKEKDGDKPVATKFQKTITIEGSTPARSYTGYDFYLLLNTIAEKENYTIFTESELVDYLFNAQNPELYAGEAKSKFVASEYYTVEWKKDDKQYVLKKEKDLPDLYTKEVAEEETNYNPYADVKTSKGTNARHYNLGYAYFYAPIEHLAAFKNEAGDPLTKAVGQYGVVRNHSYKLTVNSITSLGAPLDDDHFGTDPDNPTPDPEDPGEEPIIPDPDEAALIRAELKVLSWHVVSQGVDL